MTGMSHIKVARLSEMMPSKKAFEYQLDRNACSCSSKLPIAVLVVDKNNQCFSNEYIGDCSCDAFLVADHLATVLGLPIYDDGNVF